MTYSAARSILIVDDEQSIRKLLREGLTDEGFTVLTAGTPDAALESLERDRPDIVLLDLMLPGMEGVELAEMIKQRFSVAIIAMSASHALLARAESLPFFSGTIPKPFDWDTLLARVEGLQA